MKSATKKPCECPNDLPKVGGDDGGNLPFKQRIPVRKWQKMGKMRPKDAVYPKPEPPPQKPHNWFHVPVSLWHSAVHIYIGDRRSMMQTMPDALAAYGYNFDTYRRECDAFVENNPNFLNKEDNAGDTRSGFTDVFIRLAGMTYEVTDLGVLLHECLHAANIILRNVNLLGDTNVEGLAYTQEYIYTRFLRQYVERITPSNVKGDITKED